MQIEVSVGEIVDKLSILEIKRNNITDQAKLENVRREFEYLQDIVFDRLQIETKDYKELLEINSVLWQVEDNIRVKEVEKQFDKEFVELARSVYIVNDQRAKLKRKINIKYNSTFIEEKSYTEHESIN